MADRLYVVKNKATGEEELVEGASQNGAIGRLVRANYEASPAKPGDVARLYDAGKRPIRQEPEGEAA